MSTEVEKTVKIVPFTSKSLWSIWSKQFLARAHIRGYRGILQGTTKVITKATKKGDLDVSVLRKLNQDAYNDLLLSFSDLVNFNLVDKACTNDLPDGDARQAWENLLNKHEPSSAATKVNLKMELSQSKMTDIKNDPDEWVTGLELLRIKLSKLKVKISDEDLIIHIINNLPDAYEAVCDQIENEMNDENRVFEVSLDMVKDRLRSKYLKMLRKTNLKHNAGKSTTFSEDAMYAGKYFKGKCHHCGKQGHKSVDCKDKKGKSDNNGGNKSKLHCNYCNKNGHSEDFCYKKKREQRNQQNESADAVEEITIADEEFCMFTEEANAVSNADSCSNLWIGDSGASSHMTNSLQGIHHITDICVNVRVGDGRIC